MTHSRKSFPLASLFALMLATGSVHATDGYFPIGYGMKAKGMGGASLTQTDNAFAGANNPAIAAFAGNRIDAGLDVFMPDRGMSRTGSQYGLDASVESGHGSFWIPEFGYNATVNDKIGAGITVYGNGGMNTDYAGGQINCGRGPANVLCGSGNLGINMSQLIFAPTVAYKLNPDNAVGLSLLFVYQQFGATGLQAFGQASLAPSNLTNNNTDSSTGVGLRLGYLGKVTDKISLGASYSPKVSMSRFDKYAGLFAESGKFDIPENYALGASIKATPELLVAVDYQRINYAGVPSVGNPSSNIGGCMMGNPANCLGGSSGPGFGWKNINVWKVGVEWQATPQWTLRAGVNVANNPVQSADVTFNIIAPGVTTSHFTLGGTYALSQTSELSFAYMHAPRQSVSGSSMFNAMMGPGAGGTETIYMSQNSIGVQYAWRW